MHDDLEASTRQLQQLAAALESSRRVQRRAARESDAADLAAEAVDDLLDIVRSANLIGESLLPRLERLSPQHVEFEDVPDDIAEELRQISYHVRNTKLFDYVNDM